MKFEKLKTTALNLLVLLSIFLTYQLWTFQPDYEQLDNLKTVEKYTLASEKKLSSVIQPLQAFFHFEGNHVGAYNLNDFQDVYLLFLEGSYSDLRVESLDLEELNRVTEKENSVEFVYPDGLPMTIFNQLLDFNDEESLLTEVNRIVLFEQVVRDQINTKVWFISDENNSYVEARLTNQSFSQYKKLYNQNSDSFVELSRMVLNEGQPPVYFPVNPVEAHEYQAYPAPIDEIDFTKALFSDSTVVRQSNRKNEIRSYTDGSHELKMYLRFNYLTYINPTRSGKQLVSNEPAILQAYRFVNNHGGFTEPFMFYKVKKRADQKEEIEFRMIFNGFPAFGAQIGELDVVWQNNEVFEYMRSMESIRKSIIYEEPEVIKLSSGEQITDFFEKSNAYEINQVENITMGYTINEYENYIIFSPSWYILYKGKWEPLLKKDEAMIGGNANGLEKIKTTRGILNYGFYQNKQVK